jgi:hypothetical protein
MNYMQAHGYVPGPTQRPTAAGFMTGLLVALPTVYLLHTAGALADLAAAMHTSVVMATLLYFGIFIVSGAIYGRIFQRAANDFRGGWIFGGSFGFVMWLIGPVSVLQWILHRSIVTGQPGVGLLAANLFYGFVLGLLYPWIHWLIQRRLSDVFRKSLKEGEEKVGCCPELPEHGKRPRSVH